MDSNVMHGATTANRWWGSFEIPIERCGRWGIGALTLWIERHPEYWTVCRDRAEDADLQRAEVAIPCEEDGDDRGVVSRFGARADSVSLRIQPAHADRPVVITPEQPFTLPPKRSVHLYVSLPLWFQVIDEEGSPPLLDEPIVRPTDTWHGPNTRTGELCYASRTRARVRPSAVLLPEAIAPLEVRNRSEVHLQIERVKLPTPHLSVLVSSRGQLWTESIVFEQVAGQAEAEVRIETNRDAQSLALETVSGPRARTEKKLVWQAFGGLFGSGPGW